MRTTDDAQPTIVGSSGSRLGMTVAQLKRFKHELVERGATELHHGDCVGADAEAHDIAVDLGLHTVGHPPTANGLRAFCQCDEMRDPLPFLVRNRVIVMQTQLLIATPDGPERRRSGTWSPVRFAARLRTPGIVIATDGTVSPIGE